jgi:hypothetical protein
METSTTIQKESCSYNENYTDNIPPLYENLAIKELKFPACERIDLLEKSETIYSETGNLRNEQLSKLLTNTDDNKRNYICNSLNWTGYVIDIKEDSFTAKLMDSNNATYEIADFDKKDISESDLSLFSIGSTFYWSIGYANHDGQVTKQSLIRFKRSTDISMDEFDSIIDNAKKLKEGILWD